MTIDEMKALKPGDRVKWQELVWSVWELGEHGVSMIAPARGGHLPYSAHDEITLLSPPLSARELALEFEEFSERFAKELKEFGTIPRLVEAYIQLKMEVRRLELRELALLEALRKAHNRVYYKGQNVDDDYESRAKLLDEYKGREL